MKVLDARIAQSIKYDENSDQTLAVEGKAPITHLFCVEKGKTDTKDKIQMQIARLELNIALQSKNRKLVNRACNRAFRADKL